MGNWLGTIINQFQMSKENLTESGFEPKTSGLTYQRSTNWAIQPYVGGGFFFIKLSTEILQVMDVMWMLLKMTLYKDLSYFEDENMKGIVIVSRKTVIERYSLYRNSSKCEGCWNFICYDHVKRNSSDKKNFKILKFSVSLHTNPIIRIQNDYKKENSC